MLNHFPDKDYGDYFKSLEARINNPKSEKRTASSSAVETAKHKKRNGFYFVFRLRKSVLAVILAIVITTASVCIISVTGEKRKEPSKASSVTDTAQSANEKKEEKPQKIEFTFSDTAVELPSSNDAKSGVIINKTDNTVIASRQAHIKVYPASTTKVMTLLVAAENITDLNDTFTVTYALTDPLYVRGASIAGFKNDEAISMIDLLYGLILPSGADAAAALAVKISGSEEEFVKLMNKKVADLGLVNTHFANPSGLHDENNYTTAYDMAIILATALQNDLCKKILSTKKYTTAKTPQNPEGIPLSSTLFDYMYGTEPEIATILSGKTGFVNQSGYCIASYGKNNTNNNEYIVVTMGNSSRWPAFHGQIDLYKEFAK